MKILLIEDNPGDARLVQELLKETRGHFTISVAEKLELGLKLLLSQDVDAVLLDLNLPDSRGMATLTELETRFPHIPFVIMTSIDDEELARQAVRSGAQDYLVKGSVTGELLRRTLLYAIERKQAAEALRKAHDELEMRVQERTKELNEASQSIKTERQRFFDVLEMLPAYVVLLSPDYHVSFANRFFRERFGESCGRRCYEYLFERTEPCPICETYTVLKTNAPHHWEWTGPDGRNYDIFDFPFTDTDGSPLIMEVGIDITERKQAEKALREINETLELRVAERSGELQAANASLLDSRRAALNMMEDALAVRKQAEEANAGLLREVTERKKAEERILYQNAVVDGVGRILHEALTAATEEELGRACLAIAEEVTQSKFGFIDELNPATGRLDVIAISDPGWDLCRMEDKTGHGKEPISLNIHGIYGRVFLDGKPLLTNDPASHPDSVGIPEGHPPLTAFLGVPLIQNGKAIGMVGMGNRDGGYGGEDLQALEALSSAIVQALMRKRAEKALRAAHAELERRASELDAVNRELEAFSYTVSHDLKAPLRSIEGFAKALLEDYADKLDDTSKDYLMRVNSAGQRMTQLIDAMLTMARLTRGELHENTVDLSSLAQVAVHEIRKQGPHRQVEFIIADKLKARGDAMMLQVVLENLLDNAWKFTSRRATAKIEFGTVDMDGRTVFFVRDDGAGFDMEYAEKLFHPFKRLHAASEFPGLGIGLAIVYRIVTRHNGRIWAESAPEKGATFYFTL